MFYLIYRNWEELCADHIVILFCFLCFPSQLFQIAGDQPQVSVEYEAQKLVDPLLELAWTQRGLCTISKGAFLIIVKLVLNEYYSSCVHVLYLELL